MSAWKTDSSAPGNYCYCSYSFLVFVFQRSLQVRRGPIRDYTALSVTQPPVSKQKKEFTKEGRNEARPKNALPFLTAEFAEARFFCGSYTFLTPNRHWRNTEEINQYQTAKIA